MRNQKRKMYLGYLMCLAALICAFWGSAKKVSAAEGEVQIQFGQAYAQPGAPLAVTVTGAENPSSLVFTWQVDGETKGTSGDSYTPSRDDLQKMITVTVASSGGMTLGSAKMFCSRLPVVYIDTENGVDITSKENYVNATMQIQGNETHTENLYHGATEIRGRGNFTWNLPKKPYKLKLDSSTDLFGMGKSKHWVLLANHEDWSLMRSKLAYDFSGALGMPYMESLFVDVILNGKYVGNYQFCEQVKLSAGRVDIEGFEDKCEAAAKAVSKGTGADKKKLEDLMVEDLSWVTSDRVTIDGKTYTVSEYYGPVDYTGGFLIELDSYDDEISSFKTNQEKLIKFKNPEYAKTSTAVMDYVKKYINTFEKAVMQKDYHAAYEGENIHYSELFDMDSLIKTWFVNEIFFNWDGMNNSNYMYKGSGEKMHLGPIWDFDQSSGVGGTGSKTDWQTFYFHNTPQQTDHWYTYIVNDPYFLLRAYQYYHSIRSTAIEDLLKWIDENYDETVESATADMVMWHNGTSYAVEKNKLKNWMTDHIAWLDRQFKTPETLRASLNNASSHGYTPNTAMKITVQTGDNRITAAVQASGCSKVRAYVNGADAGTYELSGGQAVLNIKKKNLVGDGIWNVIQVFQVNDNGSLGSSNAVSFEVENTLLAVDRSELEAVLKNADSFISLLDMAEIPANIRADYDAAFERVKALAEDPEAKVDEVETAIDTLKQAEQSLLTKVQQTVLDKLAELKAEAEAVREEYEKMKAEAELLKLQAEAAREEYEKMKAQAEAQKQQIETARREAAEAQAKAEAAQKEAETHKAEREKLLNEANKLKAEVEAAKREAAKEKQEYQKLAFTQKTAALKTVKGGKKSVQVKMKKITGAAGCQIQYAKKSNMTGAKKVTVKGFSKTIKGLKSGTKYYVRGRAYKVIGGKKVYTAWSKTKSVKAK